MFKKVPLEPVNSVTRSSIPQYYSKDSSMVLSFADEYKLDIEVAFRSVNHKEHFDITGEYVQNDDYTIATVTPEEVAAFIPMEVEDDETKI